MHVLRKYRNLHLQPLTSHLIGVLSPARRRKGLKSNWKRNYDGGYEKCCLRLEQGWEIHPIPMTADLIAKLVASASPARRSEGSKARRYSLERDRYQNASSGDPFKSNFNSIGSLRLLSSRLQLSLYKFAGTTVAGWVCSLRQPFSIAEYRCQAHWQLLWACTSFEFNSIGAEAIIKPNLRERRPKERIIHISWGSSSSSNSLPIRLETAISIQTSIGPYLSYHQMPSRFNGVTIDESALRRNLSHHSCSGLDHRFDLLHESLRREISNTK